MDYSKFAPFQGEEHASFLWSGNRGAALLIHGFPGTPAEVRGLGKIIHEAGWTAQGLLLPGFGADLPQLADRTADDWIAATVSALRQLRQDHEIVALIGYSMGGSVAINAALKERPDRLILIAPFWQLSGGWQGQLWPLLRLIFRSFKPFQRVDFSDPRARENIHRFIPAADLDDPEVQQGLREFQVPSRILDALRTVGLMAHRNADRLGVDGIILQGSADEVARASATRQLAARLGNRFDYQEIQADHLLVAEENPVFPLVRQRLLTALAEVAPPRVHLQGE
ncbi:MAG: alpha/beta fold hydrolase [Caldilineaceae bacterium]|nr:alpha/beta fold hydrolase [Caldilineaceae bacterium]